MKSVAHCNISTEKGCAVTQQKKSSVLSILQRSDDTVDNPLLHVRGGASSSSYNDDNYYNDGGYRDDRYDDNTGSSYGSRRRDDYGYESSSSSSSYAPDRYYEDERGNNGWYDDEGRYHDDYDDRGSSNGRRRRSSSSSSSGLSKPKLPSALTGSNRKLGIIFLSSGAVLTVLGITLFFNKTLMRLGNLLFVAGVPLMIGTGRTVGYFLQPKKARATGCLGFGVFLVFVGHPVLGILLEVFGLLNLFGNMFPLVMMMARNVPVLGGLFSGSDKNGSSGRKERRRRESDYDDGYYDDTRYNDDERYREDDYRY